MAERRSRPKWSTLRTNLRSAGTTLVAFVRAGLAWLIPLVVVLFLVAFVLAVVASSGPLAPFVYPLF